MYRKQKEGAIGLRLTGVVVRIFMDIWTREFRKRLEEAGIPEYLIKKYVDDINVIFGTMEEGWKWTGKGKDLRYEWFEDRRTLDRQEGLPTEERTLERF